MHSGVPGQLGNGHPALVHSQPRRPHHAPHLPPHPGLRPGHRATQDRRTTQSAPLARRPSARTSDTPTSPGGSDCWSTCPPTCKNDRGEDRNRLQSPIFARRFWS